MDHNLGRIDLVTWQGRQNRRIKSGVGMGTILLAVAALIGMVLTVSQLAGWIVWTGPLALAPGGLLLLALSVQVVAVVRAALTWLAG